MNVVRTFILLALAAFMVSCASLGSVKEGDALDVVTLINGGEAKILMEHSRLPFVYRQEILDSDAQLRLLWEGLKDGGFVPGESVLKTFRQVRPGDSSLFSETWEVRTWFDLVIREEDRLAQVDISQGNLYMILRPVGGRDYGILAFKEGK